MDIEASFYASDLIPAAPVKHGYRNFWLRDGYYVGICSPETIRKRLWRGVVGILDRYKWKLEIHAKQKPQAWYEYFHVRYDEHGKEIPHEHWLHTQYESCANAGEIALDCGRYDLVSLMVDYLDTVCVPVAPAAGAWEDRNCLDSYTLAACSHFFDLASNVVQKNKCQQLAGKAQESLDKLLPYATPHGMVCLSQLGVCWPYNRAGDKRQQIIDLACKHLKREPFGFIRFVGDSYDGEGFSRVKGNEMPWILGDLFMCKIEPENVLWKKRAEAALRTFGCIPEAYAPETMKANRNTPLLWGEAMWQSIVFR
jgi:hypothetical protein